MCLYALPRLMRPIDQVCSGNPRICIFTCYWWAKLVVHTQSIWDLQECKDAERQNGDDSDGEGRVESSHREALRFITCLPPKSLTGWLEVWSHSAKRLFESSTPHMWRFQRFIGKARETYKIGLNNRSFGWRLPGGHFFYLHPPHLVQWFQWCRKGSP